MSKVPLACFLALILTHGALAAGPQSNPPAKNNLPYLGPGTDVMSPDEYQRVYKTYIQLSVLLGYPFFEKAGAPCEHDLRAIFRQAGFFSYPVPAEAQQIHRGKFQAKGFQVEFYEMGGISIQVVRDQKSSALDRVILVNSSSPKATAKLLTALHHEILGLDRDPRTGLERVKGIPVGYPHPLLSPEGQGLYFKVLRFNGKLAACEPLDFLDNSWVGGFDLNGKTCEALQNSVNQVWAGKLSAHEFAADQVAQMKEHALQNALAKGISKENAQMIVDRNFVEPIVSEVNVIGNSMRNLAQCNALAIGASSNGGKGGGGPGGENQGSAARGEGASGNDSGHSPSGSGSGKGPGSGGSHSAQ